MDFFEELNKLNELALGKTGNLTGIVGNLLVFDTRDENFHSLNNRFPGGFLLISQIYNNEQMNELNQEQQQELVGFLRTQIFDHQDFDSIKLCVCQDFNSTLNRSCLLGLLKHYCQFLGIHSKKEQCEDTLQELITFNLKYRYIVLESNLIPLNFKIVRDLLFVLALKQVKLNSRIVFYVHQEQPEIELEHIKKSLISYIVLDPKEDGTCEYNIYTVSNPTGFLTKLEDTKSTLNKIAINEIIPNEPTTSSLSSNQDTYSVVSRFDIYSDSFHKTSLEYQKENSLHINDEAILHNNLNRSKCINLFPGTCLSLFVRWNLPFDDILYPNLPKLNPTSIDEGLIFFKVDINQIKDPSLVSMIEGIDFLEWLICSNSNNQASSLQKYDSLSSGIQIENKELQIMAFKFIKSLSNIWGYSIMEHFDSNKEENKTETHLENDCFYIKGSSNGRIDADYTDLLWNFLVNIRDEKLIFNLVSILLDEIEKSSSQQLYKNRFIPQIRSDNTTIFSKLVRIAIETYKQSQYLGQNYENSQENQETENKEKHIQWESIRNKYFGEIKNLQLVLIEIGFECIISDMKMHVRKSEPLIEDSNFDWHLNDLYLESKKLLEGLNVVEIKQKYYELLGRVRKLIPVCYISNILKTYNCSWDISKKLIRSTIKYYSNQNIQETLPTIFLAPIFNKTMITQIISSNLPSQIEISSIKTQGGSGRGILSLNRVDSIELPNLDSKLNESIIKFNKLPICIWRTFSDLEESRHLPCHYTIQIEESLA